MALLKRRALPTLMIAALVMLHGSAAGGAEITMKLLRITGKVEYKAAGSDKWMVASERMPVQVGDALRTDKSSSAVIRISKDNYTMLGPSAAVVVASAATVAVDASKSGVNLRNEKQDIALFQVAGQMSHSLKGLHNGASVKLVTPVSVAGVRGTDVATSFEPVGMPANTPVNFSVSVSLLPASIEGGRSGEYGISVDLSYGTGAPPSRFVFTLGNAIPTVQTGLAGGEYLPAIFGTAGVAVFDGSVGVVPISGLQGLTLQDFDNLMSLAGREGGATLVSAGQAISITSAPTAPGATPTAPSVTPTRTPPDALELITGVLMELRDISGLDEQDARMIDAQQEQGSTKDTLKTATIANTSSLSSSLSSFLQGSVNHDQLDQNHAINSGSISWRNFTNTEILEFKQTLSQ